MRTIPLALPVRATAIMLVALALLGLGACRSAPEQKQDVADGSGLFHFKVPPDWQYQVTDTTVNVYADEELPAEGESPEALSIVVYVSGTTTETPVPDALLAYVEFWAESRGWSDMQVGEAYDVSVGERAATRVDIEGADAVGRQFRAAYVWVRTAGREVLLTSFAPTDRWDAYADDLEDVLTEWYWQRPEDAGESAPSP